MKHPADDELRALDQFLTSHIPQASMRMSKTEIADGLAAVHATADRIDADPIARASFTAEIDRVAAELDAEDHRGCRMAGGTALGHVTLGASDSAEQMNAFPLRRRSDPEAQAAAEQTGAKEHAGAHCDLKSTALGSQTEEKLPGEARRGRPAFLLTRPSEATAVQRELIDHALTRHEPPEREAAETVALEQQTSRAGLPALPPPPAKRWWRRHGGRVPVLVPGFVAVAAALMIVASVVLGVFGESSSQSDFIRVAFSVSPTMIAVIVLRTAGAERRMVLELAQGAAAKGDYDAAMNAMRVLYPRDHTLDYADIHARITIATAALQPGNQRLDIATCGTDISVRRGEEPSLPKRREAEAEFAHR
ncbi:hypothetical protein [Nocardia gipuzkoensis]